mmetsp:Transcript_49910/g.132642  ORF Transcript_49910/g.132642 Transcript_49910/m.132642 type:complete len:363 (+) Transcript_49910:1545-2633(+)
MASAVHNCSRFRERGRRAWGACADLSNLLQKTLLDLVQFLLSHTKGRFSSSEHLLSCFIPLAPQLIHLALHVSRHVQLLLHNALHAKRIDRWRSSSRWPPSRVRSVYLRAWHGLSSPELWLKPWRLLDRPPPAAHCFTLVSRGARPPWTSATCLAQFGTTGVDALGTPIPPSHALVSGFGLPQLFISAHGGSSRRPPMLVCTLSNNVPALSASGTSWRLPVTSIIEIFFLQFGYHIPLPLHFHFTLHSLKVCLVFSLLPLLLLDLALSGLLRLPCKILLPLLLLSSASLGQFIHCHRCNYCNDRSLHGLRRISRFRSTVAYLRRCHVWWNGMKTSLPLIFQLILSTTFFCQTTLFSFLYLGS